MFQDRFTYIYTASEDEINAMRSLLNKGYFSSVGLLKEEYKITQKGLAWLANNCNIK